MQRRVLAFLARQFPGFDLIDVLVDLVGQRHDLAHRAAVFAALEGVGQIGRRGLEAGDHAVFGQGGGERLQAGRALGDRLLLGGAVHAADVDGLRTFAGAQDDGMAGLGRCHGRERNQRAEHDGEHRGQEGQAARGGPVLDLGAIHPKGLRRFVGRG